MRLRICGLLALILVVFTATVASGFNTKQHGFLIPPRLQPRALAALGSTCWTSTDDLTQGVAVALAESQGYVNAYNDNLDATGKVVSRDVGIWEINIPASEIGTQAEKDLYVPANNIAAACALWRNRGFQPWVAFTSNVYLHDTYIQRALLGVLNLEAQHLTATAKALGQTPVTRTPFVTLPNLRVLYPTVPLG